MQETFPGIPLWVVLALAVAGAVLLVVLAALMLWFVKDGED